MTKKKLSPALLIIASLAAMVVLGGLISLIPTGVGRITAPPLGQVPETLEPLVSATTEPAPAQATPSPAAKLQPFGQPQLKIEQVFRAPLQAADDPAGHARQQQALELRQRFDQATNMLHMRQYAYAITALHRVIELAPQSAAAQVNLGYAYLGLERFEQAQSAFQSAMHLRPEQANAYYGLAITHENQGDLEAAMGAMKIFLDFSRGTAPDNAYVRRGRSALWEWQAKLGDGPWGPTRGVPPGWTEEMIRRDGTGVDVGVYGMQRGENMEQAEQRRKQEALETPTTLEAG